MDKEHWKRLRDDWCQRVNRGQHTVAARIENDVPLAIVIATGIKKPA
jgi:hypothetical protein